MFAAGMRRFVAGWVALAVLVLAVPAVAAGSVKLIKSTVQEDSKGRWKLKFTIDYGKVPHIGHIPMTFSFKQTAIYERYTDDDTGSTPATRTVPMRNAEPNNLPVDVGFSNSKGEMFRVTKFGIALSRRNDFEAGEYELTVRESSGRKIGGKVRIKLQGKNKVINRGSLDFGSPKPRAKSKPKPEVDPEESRVRGPAEDMGPDLSDIPDVVDDDDQPDPVRPKQGGCGCHVVGAAPATPSSSWVFLLGLLVFRWRTVFGARRRDRAC